MKDKLFNAVEICGILGQLTVRLASEHPHGTPALILAGKLKNFSQSPDQIGLCLLKMSDNLDFIQIEKFKNSVSVSDYHCLQYVRKKCALSENIIFTLHIGYDCLHCLHEAKEESLLKEQSCSYTKLLNFLLRTKFCVKIRGDCSRLEGRLRRACGEVKNTFKGKSGAS